MIVGHRGASHSAPENTLAAFELAWAEGADGVEGDFRLTRDGQIVCIHDADTSRTAGKSMVVADSTMKELQQLDVGSWKHPRYAGERLPTLEAVLEAVPEGKLFFIELKTGSEVVPALKKVLADSPVPRDQLVIIAFDADLIRECKKELPEVRAHWLTGYKRFVGGWTPSTGEVLETLRLTGANGLGSKAEATAFDAEFIAAMRDGGIDEFHVWTVDDPDLARFYIDQGVWSLTTNRPGWLREQLGDALR